MAMKRQGSVVVILAASLLHAPTTALGLVVTAKSPVEKVVKLLGDLKVRLEEDGKQDQQVFDRYACWCETTTARKAQAIESAKAELRALGQDILSLKGKVASLSSEIQQTTQDMSDNVHSQKLATAIRSKENAAYVAESAEMKQAIAALETAITVLRTAGAASLLQHSATVAAPAHAIAALEQALAKAPSRVAAKLEQKGNDVPSRLALLRSYAKSLSTSGAHYSPQSATIQGILTDMYQTFVADQQGADTSEATQNTNFEALIATKQTELVQLEDKLRKVEKTKAESEQMLAESTQAYDDTEEQLKADIEFFDTTKTGCTAKAEAWQTRNSLRAQEVGGIAEALRILTSDEARELFEKSIKPGMSPSLLQVGTLDAASPIAVKKAFEALKVQASTSHSLRLASLAAQVQAASAGHFDKVLTAIDNLVDQLKGENSADVAKRDQCLDEYQKINSTVADLTWKVEVNDASIDKLSALVTNLEQQLVATVNEINAVKQQIIDMNTQRTADNEVFLQGKKEDEDAIVLLEQAKGAIAKYYTDNNIDLGKLQNFLQQEPEFERHQDDAPDATFSHKGHRKGESKGIISILSMLIEDLGAEIKEGQEAEKVAQLSFEKASLAAQNLQGKLEEKKVNLDAAAAGRKSDRSDEEADKVRNVAAQDGEETYRKEIQPDCDFVIRNFASRAEKRTTEMDGLRSAREYLAGYSADDASLVQAQRRPLLSSSPSLRAVHRLGA